MEFGTCGGLGPEGAKVLHRLVKRAASWQEGELRALRQRELLETCRGFGRPTKARVRVSG